MLTEREAIEKLIRDVDSADRIRTEVPRRIFSLFAIVILLGFGLMVLALRFDRRDRAIDEVPMRR
jgi:uncharacterized membrane protein YidH (DUF202 family)